MLSAKCCPLTDWNWRFAALEETLQEVHPPISVTFIPLKHKGNSQIFPIMTWKVSWDPDSNKCNSAGILVLFNIAFCWNLKVKIHIWDISRSIDSFPGTFVYGKKLWRCVKIKNVLFFQQKMNIIFYDVCFRPQLCNSNSYLLGFHGS